MILLDTCVLFWIECNPDRLSTPAREALGTPGAAAFASAISAFELGLKARKRQIELPLSAGRWVEEVCRRRGIHLLALDARAAGTSAELSPIHSDPCDRFLIATALERRFTIISPDPQIAAYPDVKVIW